MTSAHPTARTAASATALTVLGGGLVAVQARVNGALAVRVGSLVTTLVSFAIGLAGVALLLLDPARRRRLALVRSRELAWWHRLGGLGGASIILSLAVAVPLVGVAVSSVCLIAGQTAAGLLVDGAGLAPGGRRPVDGMRLSGALVAVVAVAVTQVGSPIAVQPLVVAMLVVAGGLGSVQVAANGHVRHVTGDPVVAAAVNFAGGLVVAVVVVAVAAAAGQLPSPHWPTDPVPYLGGLLGLGFILIAAVTVRTLGVLRLTLAGVTGQLSGALLVDVVTPVTGRGVTVAEVVGVGMTGVAVVLTARGSGAVADA